MTTQAPMLMPTATADQPAGVMLGGLQPKNLEEAMAVCTTIANSGIVPDHYAKRPDAVFTAGMYGARLGLDVVAACQSIAVINGKPSLWGDAVLGIVRGSGKLVSIVEDTDGKVATCTVHRRGDVEPVIRTFSMEDARTAGLINKKGPWTNYPKRMCQLRARAFALRDAFADVLMGLGISEEMEDVQPSHVGPDNAKPVNVTPVAGGSAADRLKAKAAPPPATPATDFLLEIDRAENIEALEAIGKRIKAAGKGVGEAVRPAYAERGKVLASEEAPIFTAAELVAKAEIATNMDGVDEVRSLTTGMSGADLDRVANACDTREAGIREGAEA